MILATKKQIIYLQALADRAEYIKMRHPSVMPLGLHHVEWGDLGMTSDKASLCIQFFRAILDQADLELHPARKVAEIEDLPA